MVVNGHSKSELYLENTSNSNQYHQRKHSVTSLAAEHEVIKSEQDSEHVKCSKGCCSNCSKQITNFIEKCFYSFGCNIGKRPWLTIILSVFLCLACSAGNVFWQVNTDTHALWTPYGSPFIKQRNWILSNFPKDTRYETVLISHDKSIGNVLTAHTMQYLLKLHRTVENVTSSFNDTYDDLCLNRSVPY